MVVRFGVFGLSRLRVCMVKSWLCLSASDISKYRGTIGLHCKNDKRRTWLQNLDWWVCIVIVSHCFSKSLRLRYFRLLHRVSIKVKCCVLWI
jgi:hypothetical protein